MLRASYRRLAKLHHPDKKSGRSEDELRFESINGLMKCWVTRSPEAPTYDNYGKYSKGISLTISDKPNDPNHHYEPFKPTKTKPIPLRIYVLRYYWSKVQGDQELYLMLYPAMEQQYTGIPAEVLWPSLHRVFAMMSIPRVSARMLCHWHFAIH